MTNELKLEAQTSILHAGLSALTGRLIIKALRPVLNPLKLALKALRLTPKLSRNNFHNVLYFFS